MGWGKQYLCEAVAGDRGSDLLGAGRHEEGLLELQARVVGLPSSNGTAAVTEQHSSVTESCEQGCAARHYDTPSTSQHASAPSEQRSTHEGTAPA